MGTAGRTQLRAKLQCLDGLLHREIQRLRATYQLSVDEFRGLYVSDEQVDALVRRSLGAAAGSATDGIPGGAPAPAALGTRRRRDADRRFPAALPWARLEADFGLGDFERDVLLLALAPEVDRKYETLYAYLNNDVTRKWPTRDLALRLFSPSADAQPALRHALTDEAPLFASGMLRPAPGADGGTWLTAGFAVEPLMVQQLLGAPAAGPRLFAFAELAEGPVAWDDVPLAAAPRAALSRARALFETPQPGRVPPVLVLRGRDGSARGRAAAALCADLGIPLIRVDAAALRATGDGLERALRRLLLERRWRRAALLLRRTEALLDADGRPFAEAARILGELSRADGPLVIAAPPDTRWEDLLPDRRVAAFDLGEPDTAERRRLWEQSLARHGETATSVLGIEGALDAVAERFVLTPGQIATAAEMAADALALGGEPAPLFAAARAQTGQALGALATRVRCCHDWSELVLSPAVQREVMQVAAAMRHWHRVYAGWGFAARTASGHGVRVLFAGAPGTGKTMTAGVIARDLGLDLYRIDLSSVVSKYIGETEKNLDRIFRAARWSNAILLFDEADALFGKRSVVKDAHDRYANIEVAYLLQKMEEHEGAVILASNLTKNIDPAFARRMHYVVEFPLPAQRQREQLWRDVFSPQAPLAEDADFGFLARQFPIAGGDIRNVALDAAFLAAQDGRVIGMQHLVQAMARQLAKEGKSPTPVDFKHYHRLLASTE